MDKNVFKEGWRLKTRTLMSKKFDDKFIILTKFVSVLAKINSVLLKMNCC